LHPNLQTPSPGKNHPTWFPKNCNSEFWISWRVSEPYLARFLDWMTRAEALILIKKGSSQTSMLKLFITAGVLHPILVAAIA
jgi:hypothetical protein